MRNSILLLLTLLSIIFMGCDNKKVIESQTDLYSTPTVPLEIAVVGTNPFEDVKNINYMPIELTDLIEKKTKPIDALIVTKECFSLAATTVYQDYFSRIDYPVFFVGTEDILAGVFRDSRLTLNDVKIDNFGPYVSGFVFINNRYEEWGLGLPENPTDEDIKRDMILRISKIIQMFQKGIYSNK